MRRAIMVNAHPAQQQQTLARVWAPSSCPPMSQHLGGVLDLARGSAVMLRRPQDLESTMRSLCSICDKVLAVLLDIAVSTI